jgi:peroxisomal 2,4-dienoyl-CoA reductase
MSQSIFRPDLLKGKTALITGGGTGICRGITEAFAAHGAKVVIMGRRDDVLVQACDEMKKKGWSAAHVAGDVRNPADCEAAVQATVGMFGRLDILVNGAAGNFLCPTEKLSSNGFKTVIDIDLLGTFNMSKSAFEPLKAAGSGVILNISATLHYQGTIMQSHVMAAKAGIDALGRNLACEWGEYGIRVVTIAPGPIGDTEGMRRLAPLGADKKIAREIPLRRMGAISDIASSAVFLVSEGAGFITGEVLVVDGGQWLTKPAFVPRETWEKINADRT